MGGGGVGDGIIGARGRIVKKGETWHDELDVRPGFIEEVL